MPWFNSKSLWTIEEVDEATINNEMKQDGTLGVTIYAPQKIMLLREQANIIKTLKHELTHVWLYEYGHNKNNDKSFNCEDVCELVASSNDFINKIVCKYKTQSQKSPLLIKKDCIIKNNIKINGKSIEEWINNEKK